MYHGATDGKGPAARVGGVLAGGSLDGSGPPRWALGMSAPLVLAPTEDARLDGLPAAAAAARASDSVRMRVSRMVSAISTLARGDAVGNAVAQDGLARDWRVSCSSSSSFTMMMFSIALAGCSDDVNVGAGNSRLVARSSRRRMGARAGAASETRLGFGDEALAGLGRALRGLPGGVPCWSLSRTSTHTVCIEI